MFFEATHVFRWIQSFRIFLLLLRPLGGTTGVGRFHGKHCHHGLYAHVLGVEECNSKTLERCTIKRSYALCHRGSVYRAFSSIGFLAASHRPLGSRVSDVSRVGETAYDVIQNKRQTAKQSATAIVIGLFHHITQRLRRYAGRGENKYLEERLRRSD